MRNIFAAIIFATLSLNANAVVINTLDGVNYQWLELEATQGMSRAQVEAELLDVNSDLYGYEYASRAQTESLLLSYAPWNGLSGWYNASSSLTGAEEFFADFGTTDGKDGEGVNTVVHFAMDAGPVNVDGSILALFYFGLNGECSDEIYLTCRGTVGVLQDAAGVSTLASQFGEAGWDAGNQQPNTYPTAIPDNRYASLLVATVVPVPAAVWLFGSALAGLGWMRRRA